MTSAQRDTGNKTLLYDVVRDTISLCPLYLW